MSPSVLPQSLLSARRPTFAPSISFRDVPSAMQTLHNTRDTVNLDSEPSSPEDGGTFKRSMQIDNKGLVGDAVGNMSISPSSRDVVLAARRGLFIIDLEFPLEVPRFLPQGGTWDVADVQWNPHPARAEYIVSTSSEKLLIWNLLLQTKTSIEHILHSHYRAITDINWHTTEPDTVASTGIDSWIWSWDLRTTSRPVWGMSAFNAGGTQVKWNRQDGNILASSHMSEVLIWDRRKGSLPISRIQAHKAKIYGIDWSHERRNEIVTCSLDKTIKVWDVHRSPTELGEHPPNRVIETNYPVWRARDLPFGQGVLSLPQRGETALEMFAHEGPDGPVEVFEGHTDVVKEFVWRKGGRDGGEYQLITWSKDRTLRFWPVDEETMQKVKHAPRKPEFAPRMRSTSSSDQSFRLVPEGSRNSPTISAPIGHRGILAEVRAPRMTNPNPVLHPHHGSTARARQHEQSLVQSHDTKTMPATIATIPASMHQGGTMSRGNIGGKSAKIEMITWMKNVREVSRRDESSGPGNRNGVRSDSGSGTNSGSTSSSRSRERESTGRSDSRGRRGEERDRDSQSLQAEITSVIAKLETLVQSKIRLEKHDLAKKRTCTLGLYGPWGGNSSVFIRVTFTFPKEYPQGPHPRGTPSLELERSPLVHVKDRAFMLRRLKFIRERRRPCLEACLRFLLFGTDDEVSAAGTRGRMPLDSESSSDDDGMPATRSKEITANLLRGHKNLAEPRTSQGIFAPNGDLVCFFRAPPRIVRNVLRDMSASPAAGTDSVPRLLQSPALVSDAVRRLGLAAKDKVVDPASTRKDQDGPDNILRIMTNLLTFSQPKYRRASEPKQKALNEIPGNYSLIPMRRSTVYIKRRIDEARADKAVAEQYKFEAQSLAHLCEENAQIATSKSRYDHARMFRVLQSLFPRSEKGEIGSFGTLANQIVMRLYEECAASKDIQLLAMMSVILLQAYRKTRTEEPVTPTTTDEFRTPLTSTPKFRAVDYFSLSRRRDSRAMPSSSSPAWPRLPSSPSAPAITAAALSSSNSSRGSWSSLFNTGSMRQFMSGMQDSLKDGLATPIAEIMPVHRAPIPVPMNDSARSPSSHHFGRDVSTHSSIMSRSWGENLAPSSVKANIAFSSAGHVRRPTFSQVISPRPITAEKRLLIFDEVVDER
ncbi:hypothetical protein HWV62_3304 [Athelia sp. TMB]|nr:hypothetical protein HWV62_3304 [Athelia sp. TMB]